MASRNYGTAFDTEYNKKLHEQLLSMELSKNTSGEPDNLFPERLVGGAYLGVDGRVHTTDYSQHPHLPHPILGAMGGEGGRFNLGKAFGSIAREVAPIGREVGKEVLKDAVKGAIMGAGYHGGFVDPHGGRSTPKYVMSGHQASYPFYNMSELFSLDRRGGAEGGRFNLGKAFGSIAREVAPIGREIGKEVLKDAVKGAITGAGKKRGRPKKEGGNIFNPIDGLTMGYKFGHDTLGPALLGKGNMKIADMAKRISAIEKEHEQITGKAPKKKGRPKKEKVEGGFNLGKALKDVGKLAKPVVADVKSRGKEAVKDLIKQVGRSAKKSLKESINKNAKDAVQATGGAKKPDGRKRRAELVKKIMKEKGLKMVEASKYVKEHGLYKP
ncbi:MAG: hypothetical protein QLV_16 [Qinghai Lake virophage]|jgi:hypothetical protein|uniref:Uncharacterized protein n=1 Tax=Qinghai Lake virophage TaxID=1516115 RepID=A0A0R5K4L7_9VIRU|nr:MAG: hypothetical protein QLV_16 [Qinghai Lake virophage]